MHEENFLPNPMQAILGQPRVVSYLENLHATRRYPNALLFHGLPGVGKAFTALQYAKYINLTDNEAKNKSLCHMIDAGDHPDVYHYSRGDDASFKIAKIREALDEAQKPLAEAKRRVMVFEDIQYFPSYQQSDALLKTVEDGFDDTLFIFTTTDIHGVFSTLKSRTTPVQFVPLESQVLRELLEDGGTSEEREVAIRLSKGSLDKARRLLFPKDEDSFSGFKMRKMALNLLGALKRTPPHKILEFLGKIPDSDSLLFAEAMMTLIQDLLLIEEGLSSEITNYDLTEDLEKISEIFEDHSSSLFDPFRNLHDLKDRKGLSFSHQLNNAVLQAREGVMNG